MSMTKHSCLRVSISSKKIATVIFEDLDRVSDIDVSSKVVYVINKIYVYKESS